MLLIHREMVRWGCSNTASVKGCSKSCDIWHWFIQKTLLTANWLKCSLHFTSSSINVTQHQFQGLSHWLYWQTKCCFLE